MFPEGFITAVPEDVQQVPPRWNNVELAQELELFGLIAMKILSYKVIIQATPTTESE